VRQRAYMLLGRNDYGGTAALERRANLTLQVVDESFFIAVKLDHVRGIQVSRWDEISEKTTHEGFSSDPLAYRGNCIHRYVAECRIVIGNAVRPSMIECLERPSVLRCKFKGLAVSVGAS
jgi:hypothetical protein